MNKRWMMMLAAAFALAMGCSDDSDDTNDEGSAGVSAGTGEAGTTAGTSAGSGGSGGSGSGNAGTLADSGTGEDAGAEKVDIVATALAAGDFSKLAEALTKAELVTALQGEGPFTVFAPTDAAFAKFETANPGVLAELDKEALAEILQYHVISGNVLSTQLKDGGVAATLNGAPLLFDLASGAKVNEAAITTADVEASNGVIHVIDTILLPPADDIVATAIAAGDFTTLASALTSAGLVDDLQGPGPFTVFAPTDAAFEKLAAIPTGDDLKNVLLYHVVEGAVGSGDLVAGDVPTLLTAEKLTISLSGGVSVNDAKVTTANILTKNGVIHVIDTVLVPE